VIEVTCETEASADAVWDVLADGWMYATWVVGASRIRRVEDGWPAQGTRLHHSVGVWPALLDDSTSVLAVEEGRALTLQARGWPVGEARVEIVLQDRPGGGCRIVMREDASQGPGRLVPRPVRQALIAPRNVESLRRLAYLAEGRSRSGR
jgi:uncharacterized protein YndB with AHSA1/START domain